MKTQSVAISILVVVTAFCMPTGPAVAETSGGVDIHGFFSQGFIISSEYNYLTNDSKNGSFQYNEMGLNFSKKMSDKLHMGVQFFARDLGDVANNKVTVDWAYGDYRWRDWLGVRVGRIKLPIMLYNETRDVDMLRTSIVMPQALYFDLVRDTIIAANGVGLYGNIPMAAAGNLDYYFVGGGLSPDRESGFEKYLNEVLRGAGYMNGDMDVDTVYSGILRWNTPLEGLMLAAFFYSAPGTRTPVVLTPAPGVEVDTTFKFKMWRPGFGLEYTWDNLMISAEYLRVKTEAHFEGITQPSETTAEAYYLAASYRFTDLFELGAYYSVYYENIDDRDGNTYTVNHDAWQKDLALSFRFDLTDNCLFKLEGHQVNGTTLVSPSDTPGTNLSKKDWYYGAAKVTFSF